MYQALFFSLSSQRKKNAWSQVTKGRKWFAQCDENNIKRQCRSTLKCCDTLGKKRVPNFSKTMLKRDAEKLPCTTNELSTFDKLEEDWSIPQGNSLGQIFKHSQTLGGSTQYFYRHGTPSIFESLIFKQSICIVKRLWHMDYTWTNLYCAVIFWWSE